jgi:hypothetical protein
MLAKFASDNQIKEDHTMKAPRPVSAPFRRTKTAPYSSSFREKVKEITYEVPLILT